MATRRNAKCQLVGWHFAALSRSSCWLRGQESNLRARPEFLSLAAREPACGETASALASSVAASVSRADQPVSCAAGVRHARQRIEIDGEQDVAVQSGWGVDAQRLQAGIDTLSGKVTGVPQGGSVMVYKLAK